MREREIVDNLFMPFQRKERFYQGLFKCKNPDKYRGDPSKIVYRSSWELRFMEYCDTNAKVIRWASEEFAIPYLSPLDDQIHRYFPDFWLEVEKLDGNVETMVIEVKPKKETMQPENKSGKQKRTFIREVARWGVNDAKWKAAADYCKDRQWRFVIMTEDDLGLGPALLPQPKINH